VAETVNQLLVTLKDVRNTPLDSKSRRGQAFKGRNEGSTQNMFLTWHKWGVLNRDLPIEEFESRFKREYGAVAARNLKEYGDRNPWIRNSSKSYRLKNEILSRI